MDPNLITYATGIISFGVLVFASWCVGEGGEILGDKYDASIIGGLVIAWLNTAPETIFFITALQSNNPRFAVGAVSGSSIVVCTVALGACLWIGASAKKSGTIILQPSVKRQCQLLAGSLVITGLIIATGFTIVGGFMGVGYYMWFIYQSLQAKFDPPADSELKQDIEKQPIEDEEEGNHVEGTTQRGVMYLVAGGFLIFLFSSPFIESVVTVASLMNVNPILLAFFLAPIASEAPEILESISLSRRGHTQSINVAFSNLIGGTISKTSLLCGVFCFFGVYKNFQWESPTYTVSLLLLVICAACSAAIGAMFKVQTKWHGLALLCIFIVTGVIQYANNNDLEVDDSIKATTVNV